MKTSSIKKKKKKLMKGSKQAVNLHTNTFYTP